MVLRGLVLVSKAADVTRVPPMSVSLTRRGTGMLFLSRAGRGAAGIGPLARAGWGIGWDAGSACVSPSEFIKRLNFLGGSSCVMADLGSLKTLNKVIRI